MIKQAEVAIIGFGVVGQSMGRLFPGARVYDPPQGLGTTAERDAARVAFVCVPTPRDASLVETVVRELPSELIVIRSTVPPGTTARLKADTGKRIVFQPEYISPNPDHPYYDPRAVGWAILGGDPADCHQVAQLYRDAIPDLQVHVTDPTTAELVKLMTNAYLMAKVTFCNEFFDVAGDLGVSYPELRDLWLLDPRIGESHTKIDPSSRAVGGSCLPKDTAMLIESANPEAVPVLRAIENRNRELAHSQELGG